MAEATPAPHGLLSMEGRVALVTGAASGMGRAIATTFAGGGASVVVADIAEAGGRETVQLVRDAGGTAEFVGTDVAVSRDVERAVSRAIERFGRLDAAVNAAAIEVEQ